MTSPAWYNEGKILHENCSYLFDFIKIVTLNDGDDYMVFSDPYGIRHILPLAPYASYNLHPGQKVTCMVDKINCTGRVFLEPDHPYYVPGKCYEFEIYDSFGESDYSNDLMQFKVVDIYGNIINVVLTDIRWIKPGTRTCKLYVQKMRKGLPVLVFEA